LRNVLDYLPKEQREQVKSVLRAAWKLEAKAGMARIRKLAEWLDRDYLSAAASLLEGLDECFTITGWARRRRSAAAWSPPTSSKVLMPECASRPAASPTGKAARW
jgi:hypothetical protein